MFALIDSESVVRFSDPDVEERPLVAVSVTVVRETGLDTLEETHGYQVDCEADRLRTLSVYKQPPIVGRHEGGVFRRRRDGAPQVVLADVRQGPWERAAARFQAQAMRFACDPMARTSDNFMVQTPAFGPDPASVAIHIWDEADAALLRRAQERTEP